MTLADNQNPSGPDGRIPRTRAHINVPVWGKDMNGFLGMVKEYLRPYVGTLAVLILVYLAFTLLTAVQPVILAPVLDIALNGGNMPEAASSQGLNLSDLNLNNLGAVVINTLGLNSLSTWNVVLVLATAYLVSAIAIAILNYANYLLALKIRTGAGRDIQVSLFKHLFGLSLDFFHNQKMGELIARLDQDTQASIFGLEVALRNLFVSPLLIMYFGYLMVKTSISLSIFVVAAGLFHYLLTQVLRNPIRKRMFQQFNVGAEVTAFLQEKLTGARVVKTFVAENFETKRLRKMADEFMKANMRYGIFKHADEPVTASINALVNVGILLFSANELLNGRLSTSGFFLYLYVGRSILSPITSLTQTYNALQSTLASGIRVRELFSIKPSVVSGKRTISRFEEGIKFEKVSFQYPGKSVLVDIDINFKKEKTTALVGPSGSGKSTLADLLLRFYDPQKGRVMIDGIDLRDLDLSDYRKLFGFVAQESMLFNATVAENIAYARKNLELKDIEKAADIANATEFIQELPRGLDTFVGDRGVRLSGGQRQRIAIARAIVDKPQILVLDEATSSLDTESEQKVQIAVDQAIESTTAIVIAHRLSTVVRADQIIVLENGRIVDVGRHDELMSRCELYIRLANLQFAGR